MQKLTKSLATLALALAATACNDNKGSAIGPVAQAFNPSASLAAKGNACGMALSVDNADGRGTRPLNLTMQMAICGNLAGGKSWRALGLTVHSSTVYLRKASSNDFNRANGKA